MSFKSQLFQYSIVVSYKQTNDALLDVNTAIVKRLENKESVNLTLCDLTKAFDCVHYESVIL